MKLFIRLLVVLAMGAFLAVGFFFYTVRNLPDAEEITQRSVIESTKIYDRTGEVLLYEIHGEEKRTVIPFEDIPDFVKQATISVEDNAFYSHPAFDWRGIVRSIFTDIIRGGVVQGGSTITQQLAKKAFLSDEKTLTRKIKELALAWKLEGRYSKDEILSLYLNQVPYGGNSYGIEAAARTFFNKKAKDLTLSEAALLAALPNAPSYYSPWGNHTDELEDRRRFILKRMNELGYIDEAQLTLAGDNQPKVAAQPTSSIKAPHFVFYVQDYLREKYGEDLLEAGGLEITTTLDWDMQQVAETAIQDGVKRNSDLYGGENAALVAEDPATGQILAMVGSKNYFAASVPKNCQSGKTCKFDGQFNVATQGLRQPGSALKPFVYMTSWERGLTPDTILWDVPTEFASGNSNCPATVDFRNDNKECYHPENFDGHFRGPVTMQEALAQSINVPAVKTLYLGTLDRTLENLKSFGINTLSDKNRFGLSLTLGGGEVRLSELVGAYSVLAADGVYHKQAVVLKVQDKDGKTLEEYNDAGAKVIEPNYVRLVNDVLSDVDLRAPLYSSSLGLTQVPGYQIALKTGTTNDYRDAWTIGYAPNLVGGIWVGNNNREPLKSKGSSILAAVPIWHDFMTKVLPKKDLETFPRPDPVSSSNPVIRGELVQGEYHEILYYLGRVNDSQFNNWETGVKNWLIYNQVDLNRFKTTTSFVLDSTSESVSTGEISLDLVTPKNGDFIKDEVQVEADIRSVSKITKLEVYFNNILVESLVKDLGNSYSYKSTIRPANADVQNILVVRATNESGLQSSKEVIVFK